MIGKRPVGEVARYRAERRGRCSSRGPGGCARPRRRSAWMPRSWSCGCARTWPGRAWTLPRRHT